MAEQQRPVQLSELRIAFRQLIVLSINFIGFFGVVLIAYSVVTMSTGNEWLILEKIARAMGIYATLIGTFLTAISIYLPANTRPPDPISKYISAPLVILAVVVAFMVLWFTPVALPQHLVNGFALLAICGLLFRVVSR